MMRIAFRVDSSTMIGSGHVIRCLTLADTLKRSGADIVFICREHPGHIMQRIANLSYRMCRLPPPTVRTDAYSENYADWLGVQVEQDIEETLVELNRVHCDWLIVDHYGLDKLWEKAVRPSVGHILAIDDLANRHHDCDILLDQNYFGAMTPDRYQALTPDQCLCLLGPKYALLQSDYASIFENIEKHTGQIRRVLLFFGGSDHGNQTQKVLRALEHPNLIHLVVDVVIGINHPSPRAIAEQVAQRSNTYLHQNLPSLAGLMVNADLMIGAGGATTWERMALRLPSLVISIADNQRQFTQALVDEGYQWSLPSGQAASLEAWEEKICHLLQHPKDVEVLAEKTKTLVDALGAQRVVQAITRKNNGL
ncbi:MAG: UDP-2,4-diacetamido-2,4,6-trideoxy-beta-L-altropyranose hydrolase [Gammaproteobacteria bacterium]|nr:UDP-2,4-diacetamido-2,4,6-trideoxy-beta-L-altropyranose hydrolase [Gammaproteobacteria bacterium]